MPSFNTYKKNHNGMNIKTDGEARKYQSDIIMEATWDEDIATRNCYFYDYYHDDFKTQLNDLRPENDKKKVCMRVKFFANSSQTYEKDAVTFHIQMKPSQKCVVPYYDEFFKNRYAAVYPVGLYVDIPDKDGIYNRWLVVAEANGNDLQFPTFEVLRCDKVLNVIMDEKKYYLPVVLRSQNSYNSGLWTDLRFTATEDQQKFAVPLNRDTEKLYYNQRIIVDNNVLTEPRTWQISKVNRIGHNGVETITLAQTTFDPHKDLIEVNEFGEVVGMWADYYQSEIPPEIPNVTEDAIVKNITSEITYSGVQKREMKIGGNYKKFTVKFYQNKDEINYINGLWSYTIDGQDCSSLVTILDNSSSTDVDINQIKVKFNLDDSYIGKVMRITHTTTDGISSYIDMELKAL